MTPQELYDRLTMTWQMEKQHVKGMKPCPFCGCEMDLVKVEMCDQKTIRFDPVPANGKHKRGCQMEYSGGAFIAQPTTIEGAVKKWNRRAVII